MTQARRWRCRRKPAVERQRYVPALRAVTGPVPGTSVSMGRVALLFLRQPVTKILDSGTPTALTQRQAKVHRYGSYYDLSAKRADSRHSDFRRMSRPTKRLDFCCRNPSDPPPSADTKKLVHAPDIPSPAAVSFAGSQEILISRVGV